MAFGIDRAAREQAYKDEMDRRRQKYQDDRDFKKHLSTLPLGDREPAWRGYLQDRADLLGEPAPPEAPEPTPPPPPPRRKPFAGAAEPMIDPIDLMAADHLSQGPMIAKATNDAIQDEMDRRVAISREQRRMALELEKKRMDQETERMKIDAMLKRLEAESGYKTIVH